MSSKRKFLSAHQIILGLFHFLVLTVPLFFLFSTEELFEFNKMMLTYTITLLITGVWAYRMLHSGKLLIKRTPFDWAIGLFVLSQLLATIFSMHPRTSWLGYYTRFHGGLLSTLTYTTLFYAFVSNFQKSHLKPLLTSALISALLVSGYAILEHFGHSPSCLVVTNGESFGVDCWVQDVQSRVFATFGQPNWLAAYVIMLIPVAAILSISKNVSLPKRFFYIATTLALFTTLIFTRSRSGILGLLVGVLVFAGATAFWYLIRKSSQKKLLTRLQKRFALLLSAGIVVLALIFGTEFTPSLAKLIAPPGEKQSTGSVGAESEAPAAPVVNRLEIGGTDSGEIRKIVWEGALKIWQRYPLFGSGVETFAYSYYLDRPAAHNLVSEWDFLYNKAHNEFLNFLATSGFVGFMAYCLMLGAFVWQVFRQNIFNQSAEKQSTEKSPLFAFALLSGVAAVTVSNFFGFSTVMVSVLLFLFYGFWVVAGEMAKENSLEFEPPESSLRMMLASLLLLPILIGLSSIYSTWTADKAFANSKALLQLGYTQEGFSELQTAIAKSPREALYYDELSEQYARAAVYQLETAQDATGAAQLTQAALAASDQALKLNSVHLNFYKTRVRVLLTLAQLDPAFISAARDTLLTAVEKSPTDAKLYYHLGLVYLSLEEMAEAEATFLQAVELKPNYGAVRIELAELYQNQEKYQAAIDQYQYILENINPNDENARTLLEAAIATMSAQVE